MSKLLFTELLIDMLCTEGGALADDVVSGAPNRDHDVESAQLPLACVGFKHPGSQGCFCRIKIEIIVERSCKDTQ